MLSVLRRYTDTGFLVNEVSVDGSLLCLRDLWTRWDVASLEDVSADSIAVVFMLRPFPGEDCRACTSKSCQENAA